MSSVPREAREQHQVSAACHPALATCFLRELIIPDDLRVAYSAEELAAGLRYESAVIALALRQPDCRIVRERRAAVAALLAAAGREGGA